MQRLSHEDVIKIACLRATEGVRPRRIAVHAGRACSCLVLIRSGSVKITQISSGGNEVILWMYWTGKGAGRAFGSK